MTRMNETRVRGLSREATVPISPGGKSGVARGIGASPAGTEKHRSPDLAVSFLAAVVCLLLGSASAQTGTKAANPKSESISLDSPRTVLERYCELDGDGKQLTADGWQEMAGFLLRPEPPNFKLIVVVKDFVVSDPIIEGDKAKFYVEYLYLGELYPRLGYTDPHIIKDSPETVRGPIKVRVQYTLVRNVQESTWRIEESQFAPHITVEAAVRYVTELKNKTADATVRRNAERTIASLAHQR